jgi:hypothetical protein
MTNFPFFESNGGLARRNRARDAVRETFVQLRPIIEELNDELYGREYLLEGDPMRAELTYAPGEADHERLLPVALTIRGTPIVVVRLRLAAVGTRLVLDEAGAKRIRLRRRIFDRLEAIDGFLFLRGGISDYGIATLLDEIKTIVFDG